MNIHEYQAKAVLREFGVPVPRGHAAFSVEEAVKAARDLATPVLVVKAQIHAGGRGKAGGVKLARSEDEIAAAARAMLGQKLVTYQTGPAGRDISSPSCGESPAAPQQSTAGRSEVEQGRGDCRSGRG